MGQNWQAVGTRVVDDPRAPTGARSQRPVDACRCAPRRPCKPALTHSPAPRPPLPL
jgi:hypothetical protein